MNYKENPFNGRRDTTGKVLCTPNKVPLISDQSEPKLLRLWQMHGECQVWSFRKIPPLEAELRAKRYFFAKWSALNVDRLQEMLHFCNAGMKFQGNSSKGGRDTGEKNPWFSKWSTLAVYWSTATKLSLFVAYAWKVEVWSSRRSLQWEPRFCRKGIFFFLQVKIKCSGYRPGCGPEGG